MGRPRAFDHDEARRRWQNGESIAAIARDVGVSAASVGRILTPERIAAAKAYVKARYGATCEACEGPCLSIRHRAKAKHSPDGRELCHRCRSDEKIESLRFDLVTNDLIAVRCLSLDCANGERWQDPDNFSRDASRFDYVRAGGINGTCRACQTRAKRRYRREHPEATWAYDREYRRKRAAA